MGTFKRRGTGPLVVLLVAVAAGAEPVKEVYFAGGGAGSVPKGTRAVLDVSDDESLKVNWQEGAWALPYDRVEALYVSLARPKSMPKVEFLLGLRLKFRKTYLSLQYRKDNDRHDRAYFVLPEGVGTEKLDRLSELAGRPIVWESEQARRVTARGR